MGSENVNFKRFTYLIIEKKIGLYIFIFEGAPLVSDKVVNNHSENILGHIN